MFRTTTSLFTDGGRGSVPPMIVAVVMVLQRLEGCSDREAVDRFAFDVRWKYAAGGLEFDYPGFVHTVLVDMRARLARSTRPDRIFDVTFVVAEASMVYLARRSLAAECDGAAVAAAQSGIQSNRACPVDIHGGGSQPGPQLLRSVDPAAGDLVAVA